MKTSPTEAFQPGGARGAGEILLVFIGESGAPDRWLLTDAGTATMRGEGSPPATAARIVLAVPGSEVAIHWLELAGDLAPAQAAAAARLMLADASAEPLSGMHVAVGCVERGLTPIALVPNARMAAWLAASSLDPDVMVPMPLLLAAPDAGFVRHGSDYRAPAAAFTLEPELAEALTGGAAVEELDEARFEADLVALLANPPLDLRQGAFAKRRQWRVDRGRLRRVALLAVALVLLSLAVQVTLILSYTFASDRLEDEAGALSTRPAGAEAPNRPGFGAAASLLFDAIRSTPSAELNRLEYSPDGSLAVTVLADSPATLAALRARIEGSGLRVEMGAVRSAGGRPAAELTVRPS